MSIDSVEATPRRRSSSSKRTTPTRSRAARCVPEATKRGFVDGRARGRQFAESDITYAAGAVAGFAVGATGAAVDALMVTADWLFSTVEPA